MVLGQRLDSVETYFYHRGGLSAVQFFQRSLHSMKAFTQKKTCRNLYQEHPSPPPQQGDSNLGWVGGHQWGLSWRDRPPPARPQALCDFHTRTLCESQKSDFWGGFCRRQRPLVETELGNPKSRISGEVFAEGSAPWSKPSLEIPKVGFLGRCLPKAAPLGRNRAWIWAPRGPRGPKGPQGAPWTTIWDPKITILDPKNGKNVNFWDFFENGHPQPGRIWLKKMQNVNF